MSQNQEIIEAKLCAYIDDELDAAGRADLEKHLAANPQHQRLIEELRRTSALVRNLPHESAPPELAEAFGAQLERSVLLEGVSEDVAAADLKAPRWPQLVAMAAITLLTVGLAVVVYFALPGTGGGRPQIVQAIPRSMTPTAGVGDDKLASDARLRDFDKAKNSEQEKLALAKDQHGASAASAAPAAPDEIADATSSSNDAGGGRQSHKLLARKAAVSAGASKSAAEPISKTEEAQAGPVVLVMHSDHPSDARRSLVLYLVQQNIAWEPADAATSSAVVARRESTEEAPTVAPTAEVPAAPAASAPSPVAKQLQLDGARNGERDQLGVATTAPSVAAGSVAPERTKEAAPVAAATSQPVLDEQKRAEGSSGGGNLSQADAGEAGKLTAKPEFAISCKLTLEQAEALRASLAQPGTSIDALPAEAQEKALAATLASSVRDIAPAAAPAPSSPVPATTRPSAEESGAAPPPAPGTDRSDVVLTPAATQPVDAPVGGAFGVDHNGPTTQPAVQPGALVNLLIVVRSTDSASTQPAPLPTAESPTTEPAPQDAPPVAPATQPQ